MARTVPVYTYQAADGRSLRFAADSDFWITDMSGDDGLDIETKTSQSYGQTGKTITNQSVGERSVTVTGAILRDLDTNEALLKKLVRPLTAGRWYKTVGSTVWYLDVLPAQTPIVSGGANLLNFQFKLKAAFPYWRTEDTARLLLGGMEPAWFPTPVSTAGTFAISRYKHNMYTNFVNDGNAETAFTLYLQAAAKVKNPMLWNNGTRTFIRLNTTMQAHERAVICTADGNRGCRYYTADGAEDNGFRLLDIDSDLWMMLTPGDNVLRMTADEGNENLTAIVTAPRGGERCMTSCACMYTMTVYVWAWQRARTACNGCRRLTIWVSSSWSARRRRRTACCWCWTRCCTTRTPPVWPRWCWRRRPTETTTG